MQTRSVRSQVIAQLRAESLTVAVDALVVPVGSVARSTDLEGDASDIDLLMVVRNVDIICRSGEMRSRSVPRTHVLNRCSYSSFSNCGS